MVCLALFVRPCPVLRGIGGNGVEHTLDVRLTADSEHPSVVFWHLLRPFL